MKADQVIEADQEGDKSATEIAKTCNGQKTGEPPGGAGVLASVDLESEDMSAITEILKTNQVTEANQDQVFEADQDRVIEADQNQVIQAG